MKHAFFVGLASTLAATAATGCSNPPPDNADDNWAPDVQWVQAWGDDFDGPEGSAPDPTNWNVVTNGMPYNGELEYYTARRDNSFLDGNGHLVLRAIEESYMGSAYTSGRLETGGLREFEYGRFEARMKVPRGPGFWPAFWLLGSSGPWPLCGEIDVLELRGSLPAQAHSTLHGPQYSGGDGLTKMYPLPSGTFADDFHRFTLEWTHDGVRWLIDDVPYHAETRAAIVEKNKAWVFDASFHIILDFAVGGVYDGPPTSATQFPGDLVVDYVKTWRIGP